jgi:hypothetical protein
VAAGGLSGCAEPAVAPLHSEPVGDWREDADAPITYATTLDLDGHGRGVLVKVQDSRPVKIEGNPRHPASLGATDVFAQADVLSLYDPDRSRSAVGEGAERSREEALAFLGSLGEDLRASGGAGLRLLTGPVSSPSLRRLITAILREFPGARWHQFSSIANDHAHAAAIAAFGEPVDAVYDFTRADVIVTLGGDVLGAGPGQVRYAHDYALRRRRGRATAPCPACTASSRPPASPAPAPTGAFRCIRPNWSASPARSPANSGCSTPASHIPPPPRSRTNCAAPAPAPWWSPGPNSRRPSRRWPTPPTSRSAPSARPSATSRRSRPTARTWRLPRVPRRRHGRRDVSTLLVLDANPVYHAPGDLDFAALMQRVPVTIHAGVTRNETGAVASWHLPLLHPLERWGDARAFDGTASLRQPATTPLVPGFEPEQILGALAGTPLEAREVVRAHWRDVWGEADFEAAWHAALVAGVIPGNRGRVPPGRTACRLGRRLDRPVGLADDGAVRPRSCRVGRRLRRQCLAAGSPAPADQDRVGQCRAHRACHRGNSGGGERRRDRHRRPEGETLSAPVWVLPGQAPGTITLPLGYGRWRAGETGSFVGFDAGASAPHPSALAAAPRQPRAHRPQPQAGQHARPPPHGGPRSRPHRRAGRRSGRPRTRRPLALPRLGVRGICLGHVHRPRRLHRLQRLRHRLPGGKQRPRGRPRGSRAGPRNALAAHRPLLCRKPRGPRHLFPAPPVHALRARALRGRVPGQRHGAFVGRPQRDGLQPLHRHPHLLQQLPLQGAPLQLVRLRPPGRCRGDREPGRLCPPARRDGKMHLLRPAHPVGADRRRTGGPRRRRRRDRHRLPAGLPDRRDPLRRRQRPLERRQPAQRLPRNYALLGDLNTRPRTTYLARIAAAATASPNDGALPRRRASPGCR